VKTYIQLGRAGDILTVLPLLHSSKEKCALMVAEEYASLLEGVSYVEPVIYKGPHYEIGKAVAQCQAEGRDWVCTQVNGPKAAVAEFVYKRAGQETAKTTSFQKEQFKVAGRMAEWDNNYPLHFDQRDYAREEELLKAHMPTGKKYVLAALDGNSSPFAYKALALELLKHCGYPVINLSGIKAHRLYDLLGMYERALCLVAMDSAPLQLARACPSLPVLALVNDSPLLWNGSSWRPTHHWYCRYKDFPLRAVEMVEAIRDTARFRIRTWEGRRVIHFWNAYDGAKCERPAEWWQPLPITVGACGRDSAMMLKDPRRLPFLRDTLRMAIQKAAKEDWICLTRPSTRFLPGATELLTTKEAAYAYRIKENGEERTFMPVGDMFWAKREKWQEMLPEIPDLVLGSDHFWPHTLAALFRMKGAEDLTGSVYTLTDK
jgi:hypothetical protein